MFQKKKEGGNKMTIGERTEEPKAKRNRHINEMTEEKKGWERELDFAIKHKNSKYEEYCKLMIKIAENTLKDLKSFKAI